MHSQQWMCHVTYCASDGTFTLSSLLLAYHFYFRTNSDKEIIFISGLTQIKRNLDEICEFKVTCWQRHFEEKLASNVLRHVTHVNTGAVPGQSHEEPKVCKAQKHRLNIFNRKNIQIDENYKLSTFIEDHVRRGGWLR